MKFLIVGQGIAGTLLAWALRRSGASVLIADGALPGNSSLVAAGVINPVTGKRFVKSWRFDEFFPVARSTYRSLEIALGIRIWMEQPIIRLLATPEEANDWSARCALPDYASVLSNADDAGEWAGLVRPNFQFGVIHQAARVDFFSLLTTFRKKNDDAGLFLAKNVTYKEAERMSDNFDGVIFCEGWRGRDNPYFPRSPWQVAKGEALMIRLDETRGAHINHLLKKTVTLVPMGSSLFWAGGSYQWHFSDLSPSERERAFIQKNLDDMLAAPYTLIDHIAGVRPAVKDRRPLIGKSDAHPKMHIFNGFGSKGGSLAPFWAAHFAAHLLRGEPLDATVDIKRFSAAL
ncbi:MAG: FAD-binding oxidoreductase [Saprospiraceae bacterium]|nr:FAD-binding oxidoreductase [Saprospiraceae bacterium]